ncbi:MULTISPECIES: DUF1365 domain-containing protein [Mumia]|uniref:DUF1365 domain-containing protein n=1 Tax=Mumia xiangluensis TaxID=1678900 RepID=A0ABW1QG17_9ACTN|nr:MULTISPECIES: DUF1365 domain-containing protein [Mumia]
MTARYDVTIRHQRHSPVSYGLATAGETWLVDLDDLPQLPRGFGRLAGFRSADHLGDPSRSLRENLDAWLAEAGVERPARVTMLAQPRVLGYVFDPLTIFALYDGDGVRTGVVAEVRNTYGGRHCYLLHPDARGQAEVDKAFYVSPFNPVDGHYTIRVPEPGDALTVVVTLHRPDEAPFTATMTGTRAANASLWRSLLRPWRTRGVTAAIHWHGIRLYLQGLRPHPRGEHA